MAGYVIICSDTRAKMSDKINMFVHRYAREYSATGDKYYSSAEQFAQYLDKLGVKSPIEIWHKYVLPDNMSATDFFNLLRRLDFLTNYEKLGMLVPQSRALTLARASAPLQLTELVNKVKKLNPEIQSVVVNPNSQIDFLDGVNFGFPPADIVYFLGQSEQDAKTRGREFDARARQEQTLMNLLGKTPGWIIAPRRMNKLVQDIKKQVLQTPMKQNNKSHGTMTKANIISPKTLYHGSGVKITDGIIHAKPAHINHMQTAITAVFATSDLVHAKNYAIMRLVGNGWKSPRERNVLYIQELNPNISTKAYVYELDSNGFKRDADASYYCLTDKQINRVIEIDVMQEIKNGNIKVYVLKDKFNTSNMSGAEWGKIVKDKNNFELYKPDYNRKNISILSKALKSNSNIK